MGCAKLQIKALTFNLKEEGKKGGKGGTIGGIRRDDGQKNKITDKFHLGVIFIRPPIVPLIAP